LLPPTIPIVGNGDVLTFYEAERRGVFLGGGGPDEQDADAGLVHAVMVGRGALVKPWLWTEARERRELALTAKERVGVYRQLVAHMKTYFGADEMGKRKAFYFLPWHFQFFHRVRPMPRDEYESISLKQPLLSTRVTLWDKGREDEGADGLPWLERILRSENEKAYEEIAAALWDSASDGEAAAALERLARERCRDWEREVYEKEQAEEAEGGRGRGRGRGRAGAEGEEGEGLEGLQHDDGDGVEG
jgi:tRNA-dihydrouridine synthase 3